MWNSGTLLCRRYWSNADDFDHESDFNIVHRINYKIKKSFAEV